MTALAMVLCALALFGVVALFGVGADLLLAALFMRNTTLGRRGARLVLWGAAALVMLGALTSSAPAP